MWTLTRAVVDRDRRTRNKELEKATEMVQQYL